MGRAADRGSYSHEIMAVRYAFFEDTAWKPFYMTDLFQGSFTQDCPNKRQKIAQLLGGGVWWRDGVLHQTDSGCVPACDVCTPLLEKEAHPPLAPGSQGEPTSHLPAPRHHKTHWLGTCEAQG